MLLVAEGKLQLDDRVSRFFPDFAAHGKDPITFRHLLSHGSGLPAWRPYYREILEIERQRGRRGFVASTAAKKYVFQQILGERLENPPGQRAVYSDLGFMLLGAAVEAISGLSLDRFCHERIFHPLGLSAMSFVDLTAGRAGRMEAATATVAATERCPWRERVLCGEVHDDNAYAMGGVAGHAGLFGSAADIDTLVCRLKLCHRGQDAFIPNRVVREFWSADGRVPGSTWALGWDTPSPSGSAAGSLFSRRTVGHLGFTGTSLWLDLERDRHVILLTNRVHPKRDNDDIRGFRPVLHDLVNQALDA
jgi:CubicO group peptidase (beta-lactamase class C family)